MNTSANVISSHQARRQAAYADYKAINADADHVLALLLRDDSFALLGDSGWHALSRHHKSLVALRRTAFNRWLAL